MYQDDSCSDLFPTPCSDLFPTCSRRFGNRKTLFPIPVPDPSPTERVVPRFKRADQRLLDAWKNLVAVRRSGRRPSGVECVS